MSTSRPIPIIDFHNDVAMKLFATGLHFDGPEGRLQLDAHQVRKIRPEALFFASYCDPAFYAQEAYEIALAQLRLLKEEFGRPESPIALAHSAQEARDIFASGKTAAFLTVEGGYAVDKPDVVDRLYREGMRLMTLTHTKATPWAGADTDHADRGLTPFGVEVVHRLNALGVIVDVAHTSTETILAACKASNAPVVFSHGGIRTINGGNRAIADEAIHAIADTGGIVAISFFPVHVVHVGPEKPSWYANAQKKHDEIASDRLVPFLEKFKRLVNLYEEFHNEPPKGVGIPELFACIDYVVQKFGDEHIALGSDYDGIPYAVNGLERFDRLPALIEYMRTRGYSEARIERICAGNIRRVVNQVLR